MCARRKKERTRERGEALVRKGKEGTDACNTNVCREGWGC